MGLLYARDGKLFTSGYTEIYIPVDYLEDGFAINQGITFEVFGLLFIRDITNGKNGKIKSLNIPTVITLSVYDTSDGEIVVNGKHIDVIVCRYLKDSYLMPQYVVQGRERAELFLTLVLSGKLPKILDYAKLADIWWKNLDISGVSFKVPSKIYELILATIYRDPSNIKKRFGQVYGKQSPADGYNYKTDNVRKIVASLSTFSGFIYEDLTSMITSGINNSLDEIEEPVSPLEKIIFY